MDAEVLDRFSPATRAWFATSFAAPTAAQSGAWGAIAGGQHTLVVAPTGSGKTLAAFLWSIDRLAFGGRERSAAGEPIGPVDAEAHPGPTAADDPLRRCRVVYVSPLKALAVDVERNLRSPLVGVGHASARLGLPRPDITVAVRSGDTPADERRRFARSPSDILITTPESLFLLLTSSAREALRGVETVIVDEIHAVAGTKRGAHLALSLDRLDALLDAPAQRVGLSATVRPVDEVARFLAGGRPVAVVDPPSHKEWDLEVVVPVPDLAAMGEPTGDLSGPAAGDPRRTSIWPHVEERIVDLIETHRSTLVFANSRRLAERLTGRLNEIAFERREGGDAHARGGHDVETRLAPAGAAPAQVMGQAGAGAGAPPVLARAHHGSVSHEQRKTIEEDLKSGRLPAVVATSSLELGIDMGAVDLVVQVEAPPSVASGLQRVGRAGHQVGAVSQGVFFPKYRGDLVSSAVIVERMRAGAIERLSVPANPLDVLAQQVVAMVALDDWAVDDLFALVRRSAPFAGLTRGVLESVLDMLAGRYPSEEFAELRPRLVWDRVAGTLTGRRGAQRIAVTSGGTIPDRGLFGVFIAGDGPGRRVGELDEEMVYESRVGDVITLGTSTWRIETITHDQVLVTPAPGEPGRLPFWKGDTLGRPAELGRAVGAFVREVSALEPDAAGARLREAGLDAWASDNLVAYLAEQRAATGRLPHDAQLVVERFTDELGDWRVVIHSPYGAPVHAPWALAIGARLRERYGVDVQAMHADDGIVLRLPDLGGPALWDADPIDATGAAPISDAPAGGRPSGTAGLDDLLESILLDPEEVAPLVTELVGGSALFASRFRECAGRALLLPKRRPDKRQALWQQRQRSAQLLDVASKYPAFPIVLEAVRECVQDVFDVPGLVELLRRVRAREVSVVEVTTKSPSPFAASLLFGYVAQFLYEGDAPLAEKRAAALSLDPDLLAELLGTAEGLSLRELLDPAALARTEAELQHLAEGRRARDADEVTDLLRVLGPLTASEIAARSETGEDDESAAPGGSAAETPSDPSGSGPAAQDVGPPGEPPPPPPPAVAGWLGELEAAGRVFRARIGAREVYAGIEDAGRLRDALGVPLPRGVPDAFAAPVADPLGDLLTRYARTHVPFTLEEVASWLGLGRAIVADGLRRLVADGRLAEGEFRPDAATREFCDPGVLRTIRRRSVAALRAEVEPVPRADFGRFLPAWQGVGGQLRGAEGVLRAVEQLAGAVLPASAVESLILPARVRDYAPALLDELCAAGEVVWRGHGSLAGRDGWVSLYPAELADLGVRAGAPEGELQRALYDALAEGGAYFFAALAAAAPPASEQSLAEALWELVWKGLVTNDTVAPLRARLGAGGTAHRARAAAPRGRYGRVRPSVPRRSAPPDAVGRWSRLSDPPTVTPAIPPLQTPPPQPPTPPGRSADAERLVWRSEVLLDRYGVLTRGSVRAEEVEGGFAGVYKVLSAAEDAGRVRRGYFVEGLGAAQFATVGAIDRLRAAPDAGTVVLSACDPANPYGAALPWPEPPARGAGGGRTARVGAAAAAAGVASGAARAGPSDAPGAGGAAERQGHRPARKAGALVVLSGGEPVVYLERGGHTALTWTDDPVVLGASARELAGLVHTGRLAALTVERCDGAATLTGEHPFAAALLDAGFRPTPKGLRLRR